ncbi:sulfite exporter TauE/SafE family protein, partial [Romboutsia sp.]|uniref:sulfite exporter TauE/SafE family protein n=1 Tax=Romboutsia sp. TaxID=1965302 RepID=UPI003F2F0DE6
MLEILKMYLIICPLVFLGGFVDAIAGGGGFISLPAYIISGVPVHTAIGTNKLSSAMGTTLTTYRFAKSGYIKFKIGIYCAIFALAGSYIGAKTALLIDADSFKIIMLVILPLTSMYVLFKKDLIKDVEENEVEDFSSKKTFYYSLPISFFIGMYDGFYGPGTGTFLILLLT